MKYILIDTNIYIQCSLLELEGDDLEVLKKLQSLLEENKLTLLLPEVVELEFDKVLQEKFEGIISQIDGYKGLIGKDKALDSKVKKDLIGKITECSDEREKNKIEVRKTVEKIFQHKNTERIKLTSTVMEKAYKRFLANKKPYKKDEIGQIQPDCLIVESAKEYLQDKTGYELLLCSANKRDFADNPDAKDGKFVVAKDVSSDFLKVSYHNTLFQCLNENFQTKYPQEVIEKASSEFYQPSYGVPLKQNVFIVDPTYMTNQAMGAASPSLLNPNQAYMVSPLNMGAVSPTVTGGLNRVTVANPEDRTCQKCGKSFKAIGHETLLTIPYCDECRKSITTW